MCWTVALYSHLHSETSALRIWIMLRHFTLRNIFVWRRNIFAVLLARKTMRTIHWLKNDVTAKGSRFTNRTLVLLLIRYKSKRLKNSKVTLRLESWWNRVHDSHESNPVEESHVNTKNACTCASLASVFHSLIHILDGKKRIGVPKQ